MFPFFCSRKHQDVLREGLLFSVYICPFIWIFFEWSTSVFCLFFSVYFCPCIWICFERSTSVFFCFSVCFCPWQHQHVFLFISVPAYEYVLREVLLFFSFSVYFCPWQHQQQWLKALEGITKRPLLTTNHTIYSKHQKIKKKHQKKTEKTWKFIFIYKIQQKTEMLSK